MIPTIGEAMGSVQTADGGPQANATGADVVREISPRGLEILELLNTVFDDLVIEKK